MRKGQLEGPRPFFRHLGTNDEAGFGGICALTAVPEAGRGSEKDIARCRGHRISPARPGHGGTRRSAPGARNRISTAGASRRIEVFRRTQRGRNRRSIAGVCRHGDARLATRQGLVGARIEETRIECPRNGPNKLSDFITTRESVTRGSAPRFWRKPVPAIARCGAKWSRCWRKSPECEASWKRPHWSL